jgi:threonylcarbamoyladenosine tRNA methylthiotransferase MtaB
MHRRYRPWHYAEKVHALQEAAGPALTLGADVMVGFPGETDLEFQETYDFVRHLPFGYLHLFPFSPRPGTRGWDLDRQFPVPAAVVDQRMAALRQLAHEKSESHRAAFIGATLDCITLNTPEVLRLQNRTALLSENFLPMELEVSLPPNSLVNARITGLGSGGMLTAKLAV